MKPSSSFITVTLRLFFSKQLHNVIEFQDYPSDTKWFLHTLANNNTKKFNLIPISPSNALQDFSKKEKCNDIIKNWQMTFQASNLKEKQFLNLLDDKINTIELSYTKESLQIKHFRYSNLLYARATRAITNHTFIGEYCLKFFPR